MLLVCSRSTEQYASDWDYDRKMLVVGPPTLDTLYLEKASEVIAIGGGSVIDTAKIISKSPVIAIPTTYSGASRTSHAVWWDLGRKWDVHTEKPITVVKPKYLEVPLEQPMWVLWYSSADCVCHIIESLNSKRANNQSKFYASKASELIKREDWLNASLLAGDAIEITGTNVIHALSYALTGLYKVPHAKALAFLLPRFASFFSIEGINTNFNVKLDFDTEKVVDEALTYPRIFDCTRLVTRDVLLELLR